MYAHLASAVLVGWLFWLLFSPKAAKPSGGQCVTCAVQPRGGKGRREKKSWGWQQEVGTRVGSEQTQGLGNGLKEVRAVRQGLEGILRNNLHAIPFSLWPK